MVRGENVDNATTFTTTANNISTRTTTSAGVAWPAIPGWDTTGEAGADQRTPNLSAVLQEIVNRSGWTSGNSANFILTNNASTGTPRRSGQAFDTHYSRAPLLSVTYQCKYPINTNTNYEVRVAGGQAALSGLSLTTANGDGTANGDSRDSDATLSGTTAVYALTTGATGANSHVVDIGFLPSANAVYSIGNRVFFDTNNNGQMDSGTEVGVGNVTVQLLNISNTVLQTQTCRNLQNSHRGLELHRHGRARRLSKQHQCDRRNR
jgi:hypothetical protein